MPLETLLNDAYTYSSATPAAYSASLWSKLKGAFRDSDNRTMIIGWITNHTYIFQLEHSTPVDSQIHDLSWPEVKLKIELYNRLKPFFTGLTPVSLAKDKPPAPSTLSVIYIGHAFQWPIWTPYLMFSSVAILFWCPMQGTVKWDIMDNSFYFFGGAYVN